MRVGDTLNIPLQIELLGKNLRVESSIGTIINDSIFQFISNGGDKGVHNVDLCVDSQGTSKVYTTSIHVLPYHDFATGDEWVFLLKGKSKNINQGINYSSAFLDTMILLEIYEDVESTYIKYEIKKYSYSFEKDIRTNIIDTIAMGASSTMTKTIGISKTEDHVIKNNSVLIGQSFFKSVMVKDCQFKVFETDSTDDLSETFLGA